MAFLKKDHMGELTTELKAFLGSLIRGTTIKGPAEINLLMAENEEPLRLTAALNAHIVEIIGESTLAKINLVSTSQEVLDIFSLNQ